MLQQMRDWFRYLKWLLLIIIAMFLWWAVNVWGGGMTNRRESAEWAAKVNGAEIPILAFQSYARRLDATYQSMLGDQYAQQRSLIRIGEQAINGLIEEELIYQEAVRQGLTASPQEVAEAITHDPNFQQEGRFIGLERYRNLFRANRGSIEDYEDQIRRGLVIGKLRGMIEDAVDVSETEIKEEFGRRNAKTTVEYLVIDPARLTSGPKPAEPDIARYYEEHKDRYAKGEGRTGIYVFFGTSDLGASQTVTDDEIKSAYDGALATRFTLKDQRRASHILLKVGPDATPETVAKTEARARAVLKQARAGTDFAALAKKYSEDGSAKEGGDLGFFARGQMVKPFEDAAFSLEVGAISDLVRTPYGFHIIKVTEARPGRTLPLEEARESIREELKLAKAREAAGRRSLALARAASRGRLDAVARSQGFAPSETGPVHDGEAIPGLAASQAVVERMMSLAPGDVGEPIAIASGQVVVQVTGKVSPAPRPLQEVRQAVEKDFTQDRARAAVARATETARRSGGGMQALARLLNIGIKTQADRLQGTPLPGVAPDPAVDRQIATLVPGTIGEPITTPAGLVVLSVRERNDHHEEFAAQKDSIRDALLRQRQDRAYRALVRRLRDRGSVELNAQVVHSLDRA